MLNITNSFWHEHILISQDGFSERGEGGQRGPGKAPRGKTITASSSPASSPSSCMPSLFGGKCPMARSCGHLTFGGRGEGKRPIRHPSVPSSVRNGITASIVRRRRDGRSGLTVALVPTQTHSATAATVVESVDSGGCHQAKKQLP